MSDYWRSRVMKTNEKLFEKSTEQCEKQLAKYYRRAAIATKNDIEVLFYEIQKKESQGIIRINDLYRNERYFAVLNNLNRRLVALGEQEITVDRKYFDNIYKATGENLDKYLSMVNFAFDNNADAILNSVWCADGKQWSERIWDNKTLLSERLQEELVNGVVRGLPRDRIVKNLLNTFNVGFNEANRLQRTEMNYIQNQACAERYQKAGITKYRYLAEIDSRTSEICSKLDGQEFEFSQAKVGVNMPPCHPNCRSTIIPVI